MSGLELDHDQLRLLVAREPEFSLGVEASLGLELARYLAQSRQAMEHSAVCEAPARRPSWRTPCRTWTSVHVQGHGATAGADDEGPGLAGSHLHIFV